MKIHTIFLVFFIVTLYTIVTMKKEIVYGSYRVSDK